MELAPLVDAVAAERLTAPIGYRTSILTSTFTPSGIYKPFSHQYQGSIDLIADYTHRLIGMYLLIPSNGLFMREWPYTASTQDVLGLYFPSNLEISLGLRPRTDAILPGVNAKRIGIIGVTLKFSG